MIDPLPLDFAALLDLGNEARYDPAVPTPESVLGHALGTRLTRHADQVHYFRTLAAACDCAELQVYGRSVEGRELVQLVVSSPDNLARLGAIRESLRQLSEPGEPLPVLDDLPVVTWIIANVHGGEHSSAEATLALAYHLLAARDEVTEQIRRESVVVIDPLQNPDGRDRSVNSYYSLHGVVANPDANSAEHSPPWPGGRGSHYGFDLNRDWCLLTHPETRARVTSFLAWRPQVVADLHEMGSAQSYYFAPPADPIEVNVPPSIQDWWEVFGRANAGAFDARGWDYFVKETFDSYYPGYGEAWPLYHGAIGMTYEQASPRTTAVRRPDETILTLGEALAHHFVAAYTTCRCAVENRLELLRHYRRFHADTVALGRQGGQQFLLVDAAGRTGDARDMAEVLRGQGVRCGQPDTPFEAEVTPHTGGAPARRRFAAGSLVIPTAQPAGRLVRALCDAHSPLPDWYIAEERERWRWRAGSQLYDITAWSMPNRHGLEAFWSGGEPEPLPAEPAVPAPESTMAWLLPAGERATYRALCRLFAEGGWKPRVAGRDMTIGGREFGRGTVIVRARDHAPELAARLPELAARVGAEAVPIGTAWAEAGINVGSYEVDSVLPPKLALLTRPPVSSLAAGWAAYLLEQVYCLTYVPLDCAGLSAKLLSDYNVLLMPDAGGWERVFGKEAELLVAWVRAGGTLIALGGTASAYLAEQEERFTTAGLLRDLRRAGEEPKAPEEKPPPIPAEHRPMHMPGFTAWVELDPYSYLTYGCGPRLRVPFSGDRVFTPTIAGHVIARFAPPHELVASGLVPESMEAALPGSAWLWQEHHGAGQVICFASAPTFRASWPMLDRLWLNAVLFGPSRRRS